MTARALDAGTSGTGTRHSRASGPDTRRTGNRKQPTGAQGTRRTEKKTTKHLAPTAEPTASAYESTSATATSHAGRGRPNESVLRERYARQQALEVAAAERNRNYERRRHGARVVVPIQDGCVMIVSDQHYLPGAPASRAHVASVKLAKKMRPFAIVSNGDAIDGASISRWPVSSFMELRDRPLVAAEIGVTVKRLGEYEDLDFVKYLVWNLGNHDGRYETWLAEKAPQYAGVDGFTLKEHFPFWLPAWRTDFSTRPDCTPELIVKHRFKGGMHAGQNNVLWASTSMATGHDHMLKAYSITNSSGLKWGIHCGTTAPVDSPLFTHYTEDNVVNWQEGFVFAHFKDGQFIGPELVHVTPDGRVLFRGEVLKL